MSRKLSILALAPNCDGTDVGEAWCAFMWVKSLSHVADVTLITQSRPGRKYLRDQLPNVIVHARPEPQWALKYERLNAMAKLSYPGFYRWARQTIKKWVKEDVHFDIAHQFTPIALRYPSPLMGLGIPYVLGPMAGSLATPKAFNQECASARWFTHLRGLDRVRLMLDPLLRQSFKDASLILGVAPYVKDILGPLASNFHIMSELGVTAIKSRKKPSDRSALRLLHVGRGVRTKGLRDVVHAIAKLGNIPGLHLDVAGHGEEMALCEQLAKSMHIHDRITFHGQLPRRKVDQLYEQADIFVFPSFREPSGSVIFEAMSHHLPVITSNRGGPGHVIDESCGLCLPVTDPDDYAHRIAAAIRTYATNRSLIQQHGAAAAAKVAQSLWSKKAEELLHLYQDILTPSHQIYERTGHAPNYQTS